MLKPKMVLFDFGGTLCTGSFDLERGMEALRLAARNPDCVTTARLCDMWNAMSAFFHAHVQNVETPLDATLRCLLTRCGLEYGCGVSKCGIVFDNANSPGRRPTPFIGALLDALRESGIRAAVISNIALSGVQLKNAVDRQLPGSGLSFFFTSADFLMCKPAPDMFEAAVKYAGVAPSECWYCGDGFEPDVKGSLNAGLYAVHYDIGAEAPFAEKSLAGKPYAVVNDWRALAARVRAFD